MRAIHAAAAALLAVTAVACSAPGMYAGGADGGQGAPFGFAVLPSVVAAGGQVTFRVDRDGVCRDKVTVTSGVFRTVVVPPRRSTATATVDRDAMPGATYLVTFVCATVAGSTELTVAGDDSYHRPVPVQPAYPIRQVQPWHGVRAGEGGSTAGFDLEKTALGAALVIGVAAAAYRLVRRRGGERDT